MRVVLFCICVSVAFLKASCQSNAEGSLVDSRKYNDAARLTAQAILAPNVTIALGRHSNPIYYEPLPKGGYADIRPGDVAANLGLIRFTVLKIIKPTSIIRVLPEDIFVKAPSPMPLKEPKRRLKYHYRPLILPDGEAWLLFLQPFSVLEDNFALRDNYTKASEEVKKGIDGKLSPKELFLKLKVENILNKDTTFSLLEDIGALRIHAKMPELKARFDGGPDVQRMISGQKERFREIRDNLNTMILAEAFQDDIYKLQLLIKAGETSSVSLSEISRRLRGISEELKDLAENMKTQFGRDVASELSQIILQKLEVFKNHVSEDE